VSPSDTAAQTLDAIRKRIVSRIGPQRFQTWFGEGTRFELPDEDHLEIRVPNAFIGNWIKTNYREAIVASIHDVLGPQHPVDVRIVEEARQVPAASDDPPPGRQAARDDAVRVIRRRRGPSLRGTLESFVVGPGNRLAHAAATQMVEAPGQAFRLLVVHGGCGLGKTHLLQGICNGLDVRHPRLQWRYVSGEEFTNEFIYALRTKRVEAFRARFRNVDVLVIDDIHFLADKKGTQEEFLHTFNAVDASGKAVVISSDRHPRSISTLSEPLADRLIAGMVVEIKPPDFATRCRILERRAADLERRLDRAVVEFVAHHITRNVRELEGALYKLSALARLNNSEITLELARLALGDIITRQAGLPRIAEVQSRVAERFCIRPERIATRSRDRTVALARAVTMYLLRRHTDLSYAQIVRALGQRNHTTAVMARRRIEMLLEHDAVVRWKSPIGSQQAKLRDIVADLERDLFPPLS